MANFETIRNRLDVKLQELVTDGKVKEVIFGRGQSTAGYPFIRYHIHSVESLRLSQIDYRRGYGFRIDVVQEIAQKSEEQGEIDFGKALDALCDKLEDEWDLNGDLVDPPNGNTGEEVSESGRIVIIPVIATVRSFKSYS